MAGVEESVGKRGVPTTRGHASAPAALGNATVISFLDSPAPLPRVDHQRGRGRRSLSGCPRLDFLERHVERD
jgi:hypothetical protein